MTEHLVHYGINALWQVPLLTLTCALVVRLLRPGLLAGHLLWIATLLLAVVIPLRGFKPIQPLPQQTAQPVFLSLPEDSSSLSYPRVKTTSTTAAPARVNPPLAPPLLHSISISVPRPTPQVSAIFAGLYLLTCFAALGRLLLSAFAARALYRASTPAVLSTRQALIVARLAAYFQLQPPLIRTTQRSHFGPLVTGIVEPAVVLPALLTDSAPAEFATIIAHEFAHLRRRDLIVNLALRIASVPIAFHPATMLLHARIRHTRELLADRLAAGALSSPTAYAQSLLTLSQQLVATRPTPPLAAGLFERQSTFASPTAPATGTGRSRLALEERIMKLIAAPAPRASFALRAARATTAVALFTGAIATVSLLHLTPVAQAAEPANLPLQNLPQHNRPLHNQVAAPAAPAPYTPDPGTLTSSDGGHTWTAAQNTSTPNRTGTQTENQTYTQTDNQTGNTTSATAPQPSAEAAPAAPRTPPAPPVPPTPATPRAPAPPANTGLIVRLGDLPHLPVIVTAPGVESVQPPALLKLQADMAKLSTELEVATDPRVKINLEATLESLRALSNSPRFRRQIEQATEAAAKVHVVMPDLQIQIQSLSELDDPATRARFAAAENAQAIANRNVANLDLDEAFAQARLPGPAAREALHQAFRQRVDEASKYREQLRAAGSDQAKIEKFTNAFVAEVQSASAAYANGLSNAPSR